MKQLKKIAIVLSLYFSISSLIFGQSAPAATPAPRATPSPTSSPSPATTPSTTPSSSSTPAPTVTPPSDATAVAPAKKQYTPEQVQKYLKTYGYMVANRTGLSSLGLTKAEWAGVLEGMQSDTPPVDTQNEWQGAQEYLVQRSQDKLNEKLVEQQKLATDFFAKLDKSPNIKHTNTGLYYEIISAGSGPKPTVSDIVKVNYKGTLTDGKVFDDTQRNGAPIELPLNTVIPGFSEGIQLISKGGKIKLYIPSKLAYDIHEQPGIPAGSTLVFDVELVDFRPNIQDQDLKPILGLPNGNEGQQPMTTPATTPANATAPAGK